MSGAEGVAATGKPERVCICTKCVAYADGYTAARAEGHAAGYAEAVGDMHEWMQRKLAAVDRAVAACTEPGGDERQEGVATGYGHAIDWLKRGAHVGAAKKDGGT